MKVNEMRLADFLVNHYLRKKVGVVSSKEIIKFINTNIDKINEKLNIDIKSINDVKLREIINYIRKEKISHFGELLSNSKGYYLSTDKEEILNYLQAWNERLSSQEWAIRSMNERASNYKSKRGIESTKVDYKDKKVNEGDLFDSL